MLTGTEGFRAMMDAQDAGGMVDVDPRPEGLAQQRHGPEPEGRAQPRRAGLDHGDRQAAGAGRLVHYGGPSAVLTEFYPGKTGIGAKQAKAMNQALGERATATPTRLESDYIGYGDRDGSGASAERAERARPRYRAPTASPT